MRIANFVIYDEVNGRETAIPIREDGPDSGKDLVLAIREAASALGRNPYELLLAIQPQIKSEPDKLAQALWRIEEGL